MEGGSLKDEIYMSARVTKKLAEKRPPVTDDEIQQCFRNPDRAFFMDTRENNQTEPPTMWFIGETHGKRKLKICFIRKDGEIIIKTAYDPNPIEIALYQKLTE